MRGKEGRGLIALKKSKLGHRMSPELGVLRYVDPGSQLMKAFMICLLIIASISLTYLSWVLFIKDLLILLREKQRRTQTTTGYGVNTNNQGLNTGITSV